MSVDTYFIFGLREEDYSVQPEQILQFLGKMDAKIFFNDFSKEGDSITNKQDEKPDKFEKFKKELDEKPDEITWGLTFPTVAWEEITSGFRQKKDFGYCRLRALLNPVNENHRIEYPYPLWFGLKDYNATIKPLFSTILDRTRVVLNHTEAYIGFPDVANQYLDSYELTEEMLDPPDLEDRDEDEDPPEPVTILTYRGTFALTLKINHYSIGYDEFNKFLESDFCKRMSACIREAFGAEPYVTFHISI